MKFIIIPLNYTMIPLCPYTITPLHHYTIIPLYHYTITSSYHYSIIISLMASVPGRPQAPLPPTGVRLPCRQLFPRRLADQGRPELRQRGGLLHQRQGQRQQEQPGRQQLDKLCQEVGIIIMSSYHSHYHIIIMS